MKRRYVDRLALLQTRLEKTGERSCDLQKIKASVRAEIIRLLEGQKQSEVFYKHMVDRLTVFKDRHLELRLNHLDQCFWFQ